MRSVWTRTECRNAFSGGYISYSHAPPMNTTSEWYKKNYKNIRNRRIDRNFISSFTSAKQTERKQTARNTHASECRVHFHDERTRAESSNGISLENSVIINAAQCRFPWTVSGAFDWRCERDKETCCSSVFTRAPRVRRTDDSSTDMLQLTIVLVASSVLVTVDGHADVPTRLWVTKILSDVLDDYVPDGGPACRRHGLQYRDGLNDLELWATRSKIKSITYNNCRHLVRRDPRSGCESFFFFFFFFK